MPAPRRVLIENAKTGEQYGVTPAAFRQHYEKNGFKILRYEDGQPYEEGRTTARRTRRARRRAAPAPAPEPEAGAES